MSDTDKGASDARPTDPIDFRKLFDAEVAYVWKTLRRLGVRPSDIDDVSSEVWLVVHRRLDGYDSSKPIRPWLFGIAFRVAAAERRMARHRSEVLTMTMATPTRSHRMCCPRTSSSPHATRIGW